MIECLPCYGMPVVEILKEVKKALLSCKLGGALKVEVLTPAEYITERQRKWFKGILLPALSESTGDSKRWWEIRLISTIFPQDLTYFALNKQVHVVIPSISSFGKKKMSTLIDESVPWCHEWGQTWVTYPDPELRS